MVWFGEQCQWWQRLRRLYLWLMFWKRLYGHLLGHIKNKTTCCTGHILFHLRFFSVLVFSPRFLLILCSILKEICSLSGNSFVSSSQSLWEIKGILDALQKSLFCKSDLLHGLLSRCSSYNICLKLQLSFLLLGHLKSNWDWEVVYALTFQCECWYFESCHRHLIHTSVEMGAEEWNADRHNANNINLQTLKLYSLGSSMLWQNYLYFF